jgi:hypothetical protein
MSELEPIPHHTEVSTIEFEPDLTEAEQVAVVCMYVLSEHIATLEGEERENLAADITDIAACESVEEAMGTMPMLEDAVGGDIDILFDALVIAGLVEGVRPGGERNRSVILGRNLLQLPLS